MSKIKNIDDAARDKGSFIMTVWQFVKFIIVSLLACIVQFSLLNILQIIPAIDRLGAQEFHWFVFNYDLAAGGLKFFVAFNVSNITAQIVAFFVNREKTFNANNNIPITLTIYIAFTIALICFSAWFSPVLNGRLVSSLSLGETLASNIAAAACSAIQFFVYFPVDKLLMRQKKEKI
ncbi:MAG: hypothetical protein BWY46_01137 [Firmicutes bacterium ADurb.Bin300]|jgi:putative flippase GtrA|nr:MAG: hypothetical protein BWY46_01137 [Firmicutes bacterium ADurb.Bin300]HOD01817.1 hypothetical protein [Clostridiales bacterium]